MYLTVFYFISFKNLGHDDMFSDLRYRPSQVVLKSLLA